MTAVRLTALGRDVLNRYGGAGYSARIFLNLRWRWTPYEEIASRLPEQGAILDLGSGHGLLSMALAINQPGRAVRGIDHDISRLELARRAASGMANLSYSAGGLLEAIAEPALRGSLAGIVAMDTLHYLTLPGQEAFLANARRALRPDGVLLIRDVDAGAGKTFLINRWHERIMTGLGFTRAERLNFRRQADWLRILAQTGFDAASEPCSRFPFADQLFVCRPTVAHVSLAA